MRVKFADLEVNFDYAGVTSGRDSYVVKFYRDGVKLPGSLDGLAPGPFVRDDAAMVREALGFATGCPHWEFGDATGDRETWEAHEHEWFAIYQALGGEHSYYALLADEEEVSPL